LSPVTQDEKTDTVKKPEGNEEVNEEGKNAEEQAAFL
jgi:hypothetical protein